MYLKSFEKKDEIYEGVFVSFSNIQGTTWYDEDTENTTEFSVKDNLHPNCETWHFYFYPKRHCLGVEKKHANKTYRYFNDSLKRVFDTSDQKSAVINVISQHSIIDKIFKSENIVGLNISVSYSNNDNNEGWDEMMDRALKESKVNKFDGSFKSEKESTIVLNEDTFIGGLLRLSKRNGRAKATCKVGNKTTYIDTDDHPIIKNIRCTTEELLNQLYNIFINIDNDRES